MGETTATLLFRHLPAELSIDERKDLLHHLGASRVKVMGKAGPMRNTAFAVFENKEQAAKVVKQLHQTEFLGSRLVVEFAKKDLPPAVVSVVDNEGIPDKLATEDDGADAKKKRDENSQQMEPREVKFDSTFSTWGLRHPRRPELRYLYPPPTPSILTNIMNALAAVPKFYVQVLHLMNKMDLPAPFGPVTAAPPVRPDVREPILPDDVDQKEMDISSETESELESESEDEKEKKMREDHPKRRMPKPAKKRVIKMPRLTDLQDIGIPLPTTTSVTKVSEVFEKVTDATTGMKKIELKLPSAILPPTVPRPPISQTQSSVLPPLPPTLPISANLHQHDMMSLNQLQQQQMHHYQQQQQVSAAHSQHIAATSSVFPQPDGHSQQNLPQPPPMQSFYHGHQPPPLPQASSTDSTSFSSAGAEIQQAQSPALEETEGQQMKESDTVTTSGFGIIMPVHKVTEKEPEEESTEKEWSKSKFISSSELKRSRLSSSEMKELSVFKRYSEGEPSCRLYIKNLAKQVTEEDIHWIYGRYVDWDSDMESNIFDIRLMKEGRMKGQAFVTLPSEKVSIQAVKDTNGFVLKDKPMVVQFARSAKAQDDSSSKN